LKCFTKGQKVLVNVPEQDIKEHYIVTDIKTQGNTITLIFEKEGSNI